MINSLVGRKNLARTSSKPGRTQAINFFKINNQWIFVDLPGYGFARVSKSTRARWGLMVEQLLREDKALKLAILIVDARRPATELDLTMRDYLKQFDIPFQVVATKVDKLSFYRRQQSLSNACQAMGAGPVIPYSSATGIGKKELWQIIRKV